MSISWVPIVLLVTLNLVLLPYFLFLLATSLAALFARAEKLPDRPPRSKFLIVIPAHNEEKCITPCVRSCLASNYAEDLFSVLVIADNCSDETKTRALEAGANVIERSDLTRKSKGHAIEYMFEVLAPSGTLESTHAIVIVDADTTIDADLLRHFDADLRAGRDWVQCYYSVAQPERSWRTRLMAYAFALFNGVFPLGQCALGSSATLRGNGMCFSTRGLNRRPWACYGLVEDMEYSWSLRIAGEHVAFQPRATVLGAFPSSGGTAAATQRLRWESGRGEVRRKYFPALLRSNQIGLWRKLLSLCELTMPSISWLFLSYLLALALNVYAFVSPAKLVSPLLGWFLLGNSLLMTVSLVAYAISPFLVLGLPVRYIAFLPFFPVYVCWKLLISLAGRPREWIRTARET
jgi:cellulose synthase/poly-beta-1,6-N-acetylglucosamine synthase-like glycosyltransferase